MVFQGQTGPILIGVVSWTFATLQEHNFKRRQAELDRLSEQIRVLYGPLHGNRLVHKSSYAAISKDISLKDWLKKAQDTRDADMIRKWRRFHLTTLHPLDLEAVRLIKDNSHLYFKESVESEKSVQNNCAPKALTAFVEHVSGNVYMMECWKDGMGQLEKEDHMEDEDFLVENNLIGFDCSKLNANEFGDCGNCSVTCYIGHTLSELRERKSEIEDGLTTSGSAWASLAAIGAIFANYAG